MLPMRDNITCCHCQRLPVHSGKQMYDAWSRAHLQAGQEGDLRAVVPGAHKAVDWAVQVVRRMLVRDARVAPHWQQPVRLKRQLARLPRQNSLVDAAALTLVQSTCFVPFGSCL